MIYANPGSENSVVTFKSRYENFKSFEESGGKWKRWIGISYSIVGIKE